MRVVGPDGKILEVSDEEAIRGYATGEFGFEKGALIPVRDRFGTVGTVSAEQLEGALQNGFTPASSAELQHAEDEIRYSTPGQMAITAAEGFGSGLTSGGTDWLMSELGGELYRKTALARREVNPGMRLVGELTGALAPLLLTKGASAGLSAGSIGRAGVAGVREGSALMRGARGAWNVASAPVRAVEGLGGMTERAAASLLKAEEGAGLLRRGAQAVLPTMARGAVEGAAQGAGMALTEHSLGNPNARAEDLILSGALFGALTGGLIRGTGFAGKELHGAVTRHLQAAGKEGIRDAAIDLFATTSGFLSGNEKSVIKKLVKQIDDDPALARKIMLEGGDAVVARHVDDMASAYDTASRKAREVHQDLYGQGKAEMVRRAVPAENTEAIRNEAMKLVDDLRYVHEELLAEPAIYTHRAKVKQFGDLVGHIETKVLEAEGKDAGSQIFLAIDEAKKKLGSIAKHEGMPGIETATADRLTKAYDEIPLPFLERQDLFGMAGVAQRWAEESAMDKSRLQAALGQVGTPGGDQVIAMLRKDAENKLQAAQAAQKYWGTSPQTSKDLQDIVDAQKKYLDSLNKAVQEVSAVKAYQGLQSRAGGLAIDVAGAVLGGAGGYGAGVVAKKALDVLSDPKSTLRYLVQLRQIAGAADSEFGKRAMAMVRSGAERASRAAPTAAARLWGSDPRKREEGYRNARNEVLALASDPSHSARAVAPWARAAPNVAASAQAQLQRQAQFLASKLPARKPTLQPGLRDRTSDEDMARFARYYEAARKPEAVLDDISKEGVETLRTLYPHRYETMRQQVMAHVDEMTQKGKPVPYEARIRLSAMFDIPADPSADPGFVARVQSAYGPAAAPAPAAGGPLPSGTAARLRTDRYISSADSIEEGIG